MANKKDKLYIKKWLNPDSTAYIYARVPADRSWATLKLGDCSRIVDFDIEYDDAQEKRKTLKKLDIMLDTIQKLRDEIDANH